MAQEAARRREQQGLLIVGKGALSLLLLWVLFRRADVGEMIRTLAGIRLEFFLLALALYIGGQLLSALRWKVLTVPLGLSIPYGRLAALYFLGMFFNFFLPTVIGGDAVKAYYLARQTRDSVRALASVFMDRNTGLCALLLIALVAAIAGRVAFSDRALAVPLAGAFLLYLGVNLLLFIEAPYRALVRCFTALRLPSGAALADRAHAALRTYRSSPASVGKALVLSLAFHLLLIGLNYANARALGLRLDLLPFCVFIPIISLLSMFPITMYGLGVREYAFVALFSTLGLAREASLLLALLWFVVTLLASLPGAVLYVLFRHRPSAEGPVPGAG